MAPQQRQSTTAVCAEAVGVVEALGAAAEAMGDAVGEWYPLEYIQVVGLPSAAHACTAPEDKCCEPWGGRLQVRMPVVPSWMPQTAKLVSSS